MPLTFAHPAAVIPLKKRLKNWGDLSALVIGSLAPDFAYLPSMPVDRLQSHSFAGMFWFCLPTGLFVYFLFHYFMKRPMVSLLPDQLAKRLPPSSPGNITTFNVSAVLSICFSLLIGTTTHLLWDSFTHENGLMVIAFPVLQMKLFSIYSYDVIIYKVLQHGSSLGGTLLLVYWLLSWYKKGNIQNIGISFQPYPRQKILLVGSMFFIAALASLINGYQASTGENGVVAIQVFEKNMITTGFVVAFGVVLLYCVIYHFSAILTKKEKMPDYPG
jgi:hypothetical protein